MPVIIVHYQTPFFFLFVLVLGRLTLTVTVDKLFICLDYFGSLSGVKKKKKADAKLLCNYQNRWGNVYKNTTDTRPKHGIQTEGDIVLWPGSRRLVWPTSDIVRILLDLSWTAPVVSWFVFCTDHIFLVLCWTKKTGSTCPVNMGYKQCHFLWRTNWVFCHILLNKTNPRRCQINGLHLPLLCWTVQTYRKTLKYSRSKLDVLCQVMDETHNIVAHISTRVHYCSVRSPGGRFCYVSPCTYWSVSRYRTQWKNVFNHSLWIQTETVSPSTQTKSQERVTHPLALGCSQMIHTHTKDNRSDCLKVPPAPNLS